MAMVVTPEMFISVDIESTGPIPGNYSMYQIGSCVVGDRTKSFLADLKLLNNNYIPEALEACHVTIEELMAKGEESKTVMERYRDWIERVSFDHRPIFVAFNATFDWSFVNWYFHKYLGKNPFGISGLDIKAYYAGMMGYGWEATSKRHIDTQFHSELRHTHNALDDAIEQAEMFEKMLVFNQAKIEK